MALYADEDELWKCAKHPSRRRRSGVCAACLRERLGSLCPDCAAVRPCVCCAATTSSSSSGERLSSLIESEPAFRRSRSVAIPFLRSRSRFVGGGDRSEPASGGGRATAFWSVFRSKSKPVDEAKSVAGEDDPRRSATTTTMMRRSRSVAVPVAGDLKPAAKGRGWYFPSPMKAFRQSKTTAKIEQERSPLYRG